MNSALTSTGILPFMERYSNSTREVAQDGRRGALMLTLDIRAAPRFAPAFVDAKVDSTKVTGANISLRIDDAFMQAVRGGTPYKLRFPVGADMPTVEREIDAQELWHKIVHNAWKSAEPGVLFWDTVRCESPCRIVTRIWGSGRYLPIRAARYPSAPTIRADCSPSTCSATSKIPSPQRPVSILIC
jgi:ribonucleoside-diphosphate reductase alpha chain